MECSNTHEDWWNVTWLFLDKGLENKTLCKWIWKKDDENILTGENIEVPNPTKSMLENSSAADPWNLPNSHHSQSLKQLR